MKTSGCATLAPLTVLLLAGCAAPSGGSLGADISAVATDSAGRSFALADVDDAPGDDFLVVCPYETTESVGERLGFEWPDAPDHSRSDDRQTVAFVADGAVVEAVELGRDTVDFCSTGEWALLPVDAELQASADGEPVRVTEVER